MSVTQYICISIKEGSSADAAVELKVADILKQPGAKAVSYANSIEHPSQVWLFVDWESPDHHRRYLETESAKSIDQQIATVVDPSQLSIDTYISPAPSSVFADQANPTVEVINACFPSDVDETSRATIERKWLEFADKALRAPGLCGKIAEGWTSQNDVPLPGENKNGRIFVALISWPSVARHMDNREEEAFKQNAGLLRELPGLIKLDVFHVECKTKYPGN